MVRKRKAFSGAINEDPYEHLQEFEKLHSGLVMLEITQKALQWKLFLFSLTEKGQQSYTRSIGNMSDDWEEL
jgi:hypothetical protein